MSFDKSFFGHPKGLATLFFTEMWERFSYYGMRALLFLFMAASIDKGGLGFDERTSGAIYGLYTMFVYLLALPGGWLADKYFGLRKAIFMGGVIITLGHFCLALPYKETFFLGLAFIVIGTGLLKPTISSIVGNLYPENEQIRRDAGFSIFYMGINLGAFLAPILTGWLRVEFDWHYAFMAAGLGMVLGLIQYKATEKYLGNIGTQPERLPDPAAQSKRDNSIKKGILIFVVIFTALALLLMTGMLSFNPVTIAQLSAYVLLSCFVLYFVYVFTVEKLTPDERKKITVIGILFLFSCMFWAGYEQQGSSLNLFGERYTDRVIFGWEMPAEWLQSAPPIFVIIFSPIFAFLWLRLANRKLNPNTPVKFSLGLIFMGLGFVIMMGASYLVVDGVKPLPTWLVVTYLLHTFGEICLYPVGLSAVTKLSPSRLVGQMMGIWFMSLAFGNLVAGLFAGEFDAELIAAEPMMLVDLFAVVARVILISGVVILVLNRPIRKLMGNIH